MNNLVKCAISVNRQQQYRCIVAAATVNSTSTRKVSMGSSLSTAVAVKSSPTSSPSSSSLPPQPSFSSRFRSILGTDSPRMSQHDVNLKRNLNNLIKLSRQYETNLNGIAHTQKLITKELEKDNPKISLTEIKELLYMSKTDEDLDILARALNRYLLDNSVSQKNSNERVPDDLSRSFLELLYLLKKTSKAIDYYHDPSLRRLFRNHRTTEVLLKIIAEAELYDEFIGVLAKTSVRYYKRSSQVDNNDNNNNNSNESSSTGGGNKPTRSGDPFSVPVSHMDIISKFFVKQNSSHSLNAFKELINRSERSGVEVAPFFKLRCILLALQQNNASIAYDLMKKKILDKDLTMLTNLRAMIFSKMNRHDECLQVIKNMFIYGNKIFPFTLKMLRQDVEKGTNVSKEFKTEIDSYLKRAYLDERVMESEDLPDLVMGPLMLNTDTFVTSVLEKDLLASSSDDDLSALPPKNFDHDEQSSSSLSSKSKSNQFKKKSNKTAAIATS